MGYELDILAVGEEGKSGNAIGRPEPVCIR